MQIRTKFLAATAALALTAGTALADGHAEMTADTVVATVNGTEITLGQLIWVRTQLPANYQQLPDEVVFNGLVDQLVSQQLLSDSIGEDSRQITLALEHERRTLRAREVVNAIAEGEVSEEDLQAAYDAEFEGVTPDQEFNASHILVDTEEEALEIKEMLDGGADFAATAQEKSTGPSGPNGGNLGWFGPGMMVAAFEEAVAELEVGEISGPVQTQFGWHVIILNDTRSSEIPTLDAMREQLTNQIRQARLEARIAELTSAAEITLPTEGQFDYAIIQNMDILDN